MCFSGFREVCGAVGQRRRLPKSRPKKQEQEESKNLTKESVEERVFSGR